MSTLNRTFSVKNGIDVANTVVIDSNRNLSNVANLDANNITANTINVRGQLTTQNIIPAANVTYNLGSPTARFKDIYLSGNTLDLNGTTIKVVNDEILSNTFNAAVSFVSGGLNVLDQANTARSQANAAYGQANTAYGQANAAYGQANTAYGQANTARDQANTAYGAANTAATNAGNAYDQANTATTNAGNAYDKANGAYGQADSARSAANSAANTVRVSANGGSTLSGKQLNFVNTATALITVTDASNGNANITVDVIGGGAIGQAYAQANAAYAAANTAETDAQNAYYTANVAYLNSGLAYDKANTAQTNALNAYGAANTAQTTAQNAYGQANTATTNAGNAYDKANSAYTNAGNAYDRANGAYNTANAKIETLNGLGAIDISSGSTNNVVTYSINVNRASISTVGVTKLVDSVSSSDTANAATANSVKWAYEFANTMLPKSGGTISGDLTVSGNLILSQNTTLINVSTYQVEDPLIYLASNNEVSDTVDIGFMGGKNTSGTYSHTGLVRHAADQKYYLFDGLPDEAHTNNVVNVAATYMATLRANIEANNILLVGNTVATQANLTIANDQANTARNTANAAYNTANTAVTNADNAYDQANTATTNAGNAYGQANAAYSAANTAQSTAQNAYGAANTAQTTAQNAYGKANTAFTNAGNAYDQANTAQTTAQNAYGKANTAFTNAGNAYDQANSAYVHATDAYDRANTKVSKSGDTMTGGLTITTSGTGLTTGNATVNYTLSVGSLNVTTNTVTTLASGQVVLDKFPATDLASAKYFVQVSSGANYHTTEMVLVQDATNVWISEYGSIQTGPSLGSFSADISSGDVRLLFTAVNATNTIRSVRYGIAT